MNSCFCASPKEDAIRDARVVVKTDGAPNGQRAEQRQVGLHVKVGHIAQQHRMQCTKHSGQKTRACIVKPSPEIKGQEARGGVEQALQQLDREVSAANR